ncbi:protein-disulfide reductase DsbD [Ciceribacter thiooxidans]|uniref:protein-disulfide reductase DsbD n=1 Tax=Ciceribacter thiooxidans TaxID=1969821 RepID=UPI001FD189D3|nr:protein-disulfide reductase DsbD [Ciceribacter thiooxidans]
MRVLLSVSCLILAFATAALASPVGAPLPMERAFRLSAHRDRGDVVLNWQIEDGYYLYREYLTVIADGPSPQVETPSGVIKDDPGFGSTEVYYGNVNATVVEPPAGTLKVTYQGCQDGGLCYPPTTVELDPSALPLSASTSKPGRELAISAPQTKAVFQSVPDVASFPSTGTGIRVADAPSGGMVGALLDRGGTLLLLAGFLGFGVLLAFTPCVFPMYPILAATLAREGERLSAGRGFALSSSYVVALAAAFSILGVTAAWSGQNFQAALQSTTATILLAALFVALALSNFGLFELQLPASVRSAFGKQRTGRSSLVSSAALGFSSALVIGPCVTAPLAGALLYIAQTGNVALGAASLFALGIGKGIPLILMGTFGTGLLPRAGRWMERVRQVFGFIFLGTSLWFVDHLLPPGIGLALWSALLITFAVFIGTFDQLPPDAGAVPVLRRLLGF